jgi:hypothetical protein
LKTFGLACKGGLQKISVEWPKKYGHFRRGWFGFKGYIDISCPLVTEVYEATGYTPILQIFKNLVEIIIITRHLY